MSGILVVVGNVCESRAESALQPLRYLGGEREQLWSEEDALVVVTRKGWQLDDDFCGDVLVLETPELVVAADASLFDKKGLARKLSTAGVRPRGETASHYLEAAYRAWGPEMIRYLNGDYAFVIWDRAERRLFAARDPIGGRPLYWTRIGSGIGIASSCRALAELRGGVQDLNLAHLGGLVAGLAWSNGADTAYRGVEVLLPGRSVLWKDGSVEGETFWSPSRAPDRHSSPRGEAAEELRELLCTAVTHRQTGGTTSVWMSGGWDSTAVFAAGQQGLSPDRRSRLRPVSISYPAGDPGDEDELIRQVAEHWQAEVHWIQSEDLRLFDALEDRAARYDEPPAHLYELWNRGLALGTRAVGSRVALDGGGGDQLFQISDIFLADQLRGGRWLEFVRAARARRARGWRYLVRMGVLPLLPRPVLAAIERITGQRVPAHYLERNLTRWIRPDFVEEHQLKARDLAALDGARGSSLAHTETLIYLGVPVWGWGGSFMRGAMLDEGVEVRSPLLDLRIVEFALSRPVTERADGRETKLLLRMAMSGLLPAGVLAPRSHRTGMTIGFSRRRMNAAYPGLFARLFSEPLRLADLGIANPAELRAAADTYLAGEGNDFLRVNLFHTMKTEFWLRGLERPGRSEQFPVGVNAGAKIFPAA